MRRTDSIAKAVRAGEIPGACHSSAGQEAAIVGACMALGDEDYVTGTHRSHGHPIGKGAALAPLMAELMGKVEGICGGRGGSMHLADVSVGIIGGALDGTRLTVPAGALTSTQNITNLEPVAATQLKFTSPLIDPIGDTDATNRLSWQPGAEITPTPRPLVTWRDTCRRAVPTAAP